MHVKRFATQHNRFNEHCPKQWHIQNMQAILQRKSWPDVTEQALAAKNAVNPCLQCTFHKLHLPSNASYNTHFLPHPRISGLFASNFMCFKSAGTRWRIVSLVPTTAIVINVMIINFFFMFSERRAANFVMLRFHSSTLTQNVRPMNRSAAGHSNSELLYLMVQTGLH
jgi:hypothetical protein